VLFLAGVNGSGKTTTAGKIAEQFRLQNKSVILAASDTFRAAAVEQLKTWGKRVGAKVVSGIDGGDSAAVAFKALQLAKNEDIDVVIIDTAGRLQNKKDLMEELTKTCRVLSKLDKDAPHQKVVVLDGTVGQNAHSQLKSFDEAIGLTGMIITKLDGSAKGGVVVSLAENFKIPIHAVGVGEGLDDLQTFKASSFSMALAGLDET
jgi:fused signal recognition particle receptor